MKLSNLLMSCGVDDQTEFDVNVMLVAKNEEQRLAVGRRTDPSVRNWAEAVLLYVEMDLVNNRVTVTI